MTKDKLIELIDRYDHWSRQPHSIPSNIVNHSHWLHIATMFPKMREFIKADRIEKCMRWIGFIQGWLYSVEAFTLDELRDHSRAD